MWPEDRAAHVEELAALFLEEGGEKLRRVVRVGALAADDEAEPLAVGKALFHPRHVGAARRA
jgi:hypothetical protein